MQFYPKPSGGYLVALGVIDLRTSEAKKFYIAGSAEKPMLMLQRDRYMYMLHPVNRVLILYTLYWVQLSSDLLPATCSQHNEASMLGRGNMGTSFHLDVTHSLPQATAPS